MWVCTIVAKYAPVLKQPADQSQQNIWSSQETLPRLSQLEHVAVAMMLAPMDLHHMMYWAVDTHQGASSCHRVSSRQGASSSWRHQAMAADVTSRILG